ncbi:transcription initiation factor TFIIH subunit 3 [Babesia ovis]|uniref:Transcription initiation factor TFIIH subunit 3 n=1 Tax=Babesia ovis TaxID=5869 RepID=A0A9W5WU21_BABOV|nr:transcription initiation factor TFIIH subunit 3 [Babesia ovis]
MHGPREGHSMAGMEPYGPGGLLSSGYGEAISNNESALVMVIDLTPGAWVETTNPEDLRLPLASLYRLIHRFLKTYAFMSANNGFCLIGTHSCGTKILYEGVPSFDWLPSCFGDNGTLNDRYNTCIVRVWQDMLDFIGTCTSTTRDPQLTTALSMGLLYLNRIRQAGTGFGRRIIFLDASVANDYRSQYIGLMNVAFTASKSGITINTCAFRQSSRILEQLCDVTNAKYLNLPKVLQSADDQESHEQSVLQLLMFWFLPSVGIADQLSTQLPFDFSNTAVCYCHYRTVDIAFLCPCCFAVHCSEKDDKGRFRVFCLVCK